MPSSSAEEATSAPHHVGPYPLPLHSNSKVPPEPSPSSDVLSASNPPADMTQLSQDPGGEGQPEATEGGTESDEVGNNSILPSSEELSPVQPMEQEVTESDLVDTTEACPGAQSQPNSVEMESPPASQCAMSSERDQPEGERCSSSDSIPSLAAALMELHELLVSNNHTQSRNHSTSCSPSHLFRQDAGKASPEPITPTPENTQPSTAISAGAKQSDAKANYAAAVSDEEPSKCIVPDLSGQNKHRDGDTADTEEGQGPPQCPDGSGDRREEEATNISISKPEPELPPDPAGDLEFREPPEGQLGRGVADGQASGSNTPDTLGLQTEHTFVSPLSMAVGSPEDISDTLSSSVSPLPPVQTPQPPSPALLVPAPHPFIEQFPAEDIQRIQAAGFSAREAAEALEQAHGVVELALLALLARNITVPT